jgi:hypothetical protein
MHVKRAHIGAALALAITATVSAPADAGKGRLDFDRHHGPRHSQPPQARDWALVDEQKFFLHKPENSFTGLYRTQGIATDGERWFFSWQYGLELANKKFETVKRNSSFALPFNLTPGIPPALLAQGLDHIGDIDYHDGIIYASLDTTNGYTNGHVALFNARDLSFTGVSYELTGAPSNPKKDVASWVAIDAKRHRGYGKEWQSGNTINVYSLPDWKWTGVITLDTALESIQGAKVHGDWLYMASDNSTQSIYRANLRSGKVEELFQLPKPDGDREVEGIAVKEGHDGALDLYVELIVDPDRSGQDLANKNLRVSLYHYRRAARGPSDPRE